MTPEDFSFARHAETFDDHIRSSIPDYESLVHNCVRLSRRFVQSETVAIDIGCSTGHLLTSIQETTQLARAGVTYIGIDVEPEFGKHWASRTAADVHFEVSDVRYYKGLANVSFACSLFTVQFIPFRDKHSVLRAIHNGLVKGGALLIAEKVLASTSRLQDTLTFPYYDYKLEQGFSPEEILDKERSLRGQMTLWTRNELEAALREVGFRELELIWERFPFLAVLALKRC